ncbi:MAG: ROK family protein [Bryobacteraceae bacterium]
MKLLAIDVGGTHISCAAVEDRQLIERVRLESDPRRCLSTYLRLISQTLNGFIERHGMDISGIACGFCGLVNTSAACISSTNHKYPGSTEINFSEWAQDEFGLPLLLENDSRLALLGERHCGAAEGCDDVVMMNFGTGIGSAAIMNGRILRGRHSQAGILGGHFIVDIDGRDCSCGAQGCAEAEASTFALKNVCQDWSGYKESALHAEERIDFATLFRYAEQGDSVAEQVSRHCLEVWGAAAVSLIHAYDPEIVVLGGGVMESSFPILETVRSYVERHAWTPWGKVCLVPARLGSDAALFGAVPLFQETLFHETLFQKSR